MPIHRVALCALLLAGCTDALDEDTSSTEQAVTWSQLLHVDCSTSGSCNPKIIGPANDRTCFLAGVTGWYFGAGVPTHVNIQVNPATNQWELTADYFATQYVDVACINTITNRAGAMGEDRIHDGVETVTDGIIGGTVTAQRRCFLAGFTIRNPSYRITGNYNDGIEVFQDLFGQWHAHADINEEGLIDAYATCVDVPTLVSPPNGYAYGHNTTGSTTGVLYPTAANVSCGLTQLNGVFKSAQVQGLEPPMGVEISYQSGVYLWTFDERAGATAACVK